MRWQAELKGQMKARVVAYYRPTLLITRLTALSADATIWVAYRIINHFRLQMTVVVVPISGRICRSC